MKELIVNNDFDDIDYIIEKDALYFDVKTIALLGDSNEETVRRNCNEVYEEYMENVDFSTNMWKSLYIEKKTGGRPKKLYIHYIAGDVLHRLKSPKAIKFRIWANEKTFRKPEQPTSLGRDVREIIQHLKTKVWEETTLAFEAKTKQEFNEHMDLADKYAMDANKRERQLRNAINCNKRLKRESELNRHGVLTESGNDRVFIPTSQSRLTDFSNNSAIENKNKERLL